METLLTKFRVTDFRSVIDSGWIDASDVTALIGTNEAGKTNLLLPLWKLNPARGGKIDLLADVPRSRYGEIRAMDEKPIFIRAQFSLSDNVAQRVANILQVPKEKVSTVEASRDFDDNFEISFPAFSENSTLDKAELSDVFVSAKTDIETSGVLKKEEKFKERILASIDSALNSLSKIAQDAINASTLRDIASGIMTIKPDESEESSQSTIAPRVAEMHTGITGLIRKLELPDDVTTDNAKNLIEEELPNFVYYSNYGNLDSEIYLPHVIENLKRSDLGTHEQAKARTLKVLFEFVKLQPEEILELGRDFPAGANPTADEIAKAAKAKDERTVLLQSASTSLTKNFKNWWKQGEYVFRLHADGDHFKIWVSDQLRKEEIELEGRSTGLQWFLSFYLVFLVESQDQHSDSILLLDEAGLSLHPMAQRDLSAFFDSLSETNQIIYTTHSPFLVDVDRLDRVKAVYIDEASGETAVSENLRAVEGQSSQAKSVYPVHAVLGLTVANSLLLGCKCVVVEGPSDQHYLTAIKNYLIAKGLLAPSHEIVFIPGRGVRSIKTLAPIIGAREEELPLVILDGDQAGKQTAADLKKELYAGQTEKILTVDTVLALENPEVEDLWPIDFIADVVTRQLRGQYDDFSEVVRSGTPLVEQIKKYAEYNGVRLEKPGWKVELAKRVQQRLLRTPEEIQTTDKSVEAWRKVFDFILKGESVANEATAIHQ